MRESAKNGTSERGLTDCCQNCCQDRSQLPTRADRAGISPQQADTARQVWTICPCLWIRRLGVRVPPSAPSSQCEFGSRHPLQQSSCRAVSGQDEETDGLRVGAFGYQSVSTRCLSAAMFSGISLRASRRTISGTRILPMPWPVKSTLMVSRELELVSG